MHGWVRFAGHFQPLIARDLNALNDHIIEAADADFAAAQVDVLIKIVPSADAQHLQVRQRHPMGLNPSAAL